MQRAWTASLMVGLLVPTAGGVGQSSWLDAAKPSSWNTPGAEIPAAPKADDEGVDPKCRRLARTPRSAEDTRVRAKGWDLVGDPQRSREVLVILGTATYDGMCRPRQYQGFIFVGGRFAGTLSPRLMDSRTDGALGPVSISKGRITADYARYADADPLCCPSRTSRVVFEISSTPAALRPLSAVTTTNR